MTRSEIDAFNAGIVAILELAALAAAAIQSKPRKPTQEGAAEALAGLSEAGRELIVPEPGAGGR